MSGETRREWEAVVDRIEGDTAVVEFTGGGRLDLPRTLLPAAARDGAVLRIVIEVDEKRRKEIEDEIRHQQDRLRGK